MHPAEEEIAQGANILKCWCCWNLNGWKRLQKYCFASWTPCSATNGFSPRKFLVDLRIGDDHLQVESCIRWTRRKTPNTNFGYSHEYVCHFNYVTVTLLLSVIPCDIDSFLTMES